MKDETIKMGNGKEVLESGSRQIINKHLGMREKAILLSLTILVFLSRIPFISAGYGYDPDAWRVVSTARAIAATGAYSASRLPGYPLIEIGYSFFRNSAPFIFNGVTALLSALGFALFALSLQKLGIREYLWAALAMAFTPVIYINSTASMDYIWALAFVWGSFYLLLNHKPVFAGISLGLAVGARITSCLVILPLCIIAFQGIHNKKKDILLLFTSAVIVGSILFIPVLRQYGWSFLLFPQVPYPNILSSLHLATDGVWGIIGSFAIFICALTLLKHLKPDNLIKALNDNIFTGTIIAISLYLILYIMLPLESGYLIPIVPFTIFLLALLIPDKLFRVLCIAIFISSFAFSLDMHGIHSKGPILLDHERRTNEIELISNTIIAGRHLSEGSFIIVGHHLPQFQIRLAGNYKELNKYRYLLDSTDIKEFTGKGYKIFYIPDTRKFNLDNYGIDLGKVGTPIIPNNVK